MLYIDNLNRSTTEEELRVLFTQAGEIISIEISQDRKSGEFKGFAFIEMSAQSEADKAVSMFNAYLLRDQVLKVSLVKPREQRGLTN